MIGLGLSITQLAVRQMLGGSFNPLDLFANSEQGAWYDPSDLSTLFQDAAGTTPVTALEQPVGLMLDKSRGLVLGPELVVNGDFSAGTTGWQNSAPTSDGTIAAVSGKLRVTRTGGGFAGVQGIFVQAGKSYLITGDVVRVSGAATCGIYVKVAIEQASTIVGFTNYEDATAVTQLRGVFTAPSTATVYVGCQPGSSTSAAFDNISVRELPGNHASQPTATSRPVVSARVNLLTKTEQLSDAVWGFINDSGTATRIGNNFTFGASSLDRFQQFVSVANNLSYTASFVLSGSGNIRLILLNGIGSTIATLNITLTSTPTRYAVTATSTSAGSSGGVQIRNNSSGIAGASFTATDVDLRVSNDGVDLPAYQRVNTATDYDSVGFPVYLRADGVDDGMVTNSIDFTATDKMTVVAGVRKLSDAAGTIVEISPILANNAGSFNLSNRDFGATTGGKWFWASRGSASIISAAETNANGPISAVLSGIGVIPDDIMILRSNGAQIAQNTSDQGTGNYGNYPLYLFRRGGSSLPFNGRFYGLTIVNKLLSTAELTQLETYTNSKTRAFA